MPFWEGGEGGFLKIILNIDGMLRQSFLRVWGYGLLVVLLGGLASCGSAKKAQKELLYLQGNLDTLPNRSLASREATIQKGDLLSIIVYSDNPEATAIYNQQQVVPSVSNTGVNTMSSSGAANGAASGGYLVDQQGDIHFQTLGALHVEGLTKAQLTKLLSDKLLPYLKNPYVDIRFLNFRFTVIGEVNKPGTYIVPNEKVTVLEMLGLAGDLTIYGRRDNVLVIREKDGKREFGRIDLRKSDIFQSPYFYLQQNDVVLIAANPKKPTVNDQIAVRNLTIATGLASLLSTIAVLVNILK